MKFKSEQTYYKLQKVLYCISETNKHLNKNNTYDDDDINALSSVFNLPISDIKKIYKNYSELQFITLVNNLKEVNNENI